MMIEILHQLDDHLQLLHFFQEDNQLIFVLKRDTQSTQMSSLWAFITSSS